MMLQFVISLKVFNVNHRYQWSKQAREREKKSMRNRFDALLSRRHDDQDINYTQTNPIFINFASRQKSQILHRAYKFPVEQAVSWNGYVPETFPVKSISEWKPCLMSPEVQMNPAINNNHLLVQFIRGICQSEEWGALKMAVGIRALYTNCNANL